MNSGDPASWHELLARACSSTRGVLAGVAEEQLALPTPCADWRVRDLVEHIIGATDSFADLAEFGASPEEREWPEYTTGDFLAAFDRQAGRAAAVFAPPVEPPDTAPPPDRLAALLGRDPRWPA